MTVSVFLVRENFSVNFIYSHWSTVIHIFCILLIIALFVTRYLCRTLQLYFFSTFYVLWVIISYILVVCYKEHTFILRLTFYWCHFIYLATFLVLIRICIAYLFQYITINFSLLTGSIVLSCLHTLCKTLYFIQCLHNLYSLWCGCIFIYCLICL